MEVENDTAAWVIWDSFRRAYTEENPAPTAAEERQAWETYMSNRRCAISFRKGIGVAQATPVVKRRLVAAWNSNGPGLCRISRTESPDGGHIRLLAETPTGQRVMKPETSEEANLIWASFRKAHGPGSAALQLREIWNKFLVNSELAMSFYPDGRAEVGPRPSSRAFILFPRGTPPTPHQAASEESSGEDLACSGMWASPHNNSNSILWFQQNFGARIVVETGSFRRVFWVKTTEQVDLVWASFKRAYQYPEVPRERDAWDALMRDTSDTKALVVANTGPSLLINKHFSDPAISFLHREATPEPPADLPVGLPPGGVTESIYDGPRLVIPLADVQHIEKQYREPREYEDGQQPNGLLVITSKTRWDTAANCWANSIWVEQADAGGFMAAWCRYRSELEAPTLANLEPTDEGDSWRTLDL